MNIPIPRDKFNTSSNNVQSRFYRAFLIVVLTEQSHLVYLNNSNRAVPLSYSSNQPSNSNRAVPLSKSSLVKQVTFPIIQGGTPA